jgi:hypothetical protein
MTEPNLRYKLLKTARDILNRHWQERVFVERAAATFEQRPPKVINPPTVRKVMKVAEELHGFVNKQPVVVEPSGQE